MYIYIQTCVRICTLYILYTIPVSSILLMASVLAIVAKSFSLPKHPQSDHKTSPTWSWMAGIETIPTWAVFKTLVGLWLIIEDHTTLYKLGLFHNPRTENPVLNQPVEWNDRVILNTAQWMIQYDYSVYSNMPLGNPINGGFNGNRNCKLWIVSGKSMAISSTISARSPDWGISTPGWIPCPSRHRGADVPNAWHQQVAWRKTCF